MSSLKRISKKALLGTKKSTTVSIFQFSQTWLFWPRTKNTEFLAKSIFNSSTNVDPLITNDGTLELWHQEESVFGYLAGYRDNCKKSVEGKQTVLSYVHCCKRRHDIVSGWEDNNSWNELGSWLWVKSGTPERSTYATDMYKYICHIMPIMTTAVLRKWP